NQVTRDMTARGNVVILNSDGTRMSTQSLHFLNREQKITSDELVRVEQKGNVLQGVGFESDPNLKHYQFRTQVTGTVRSGVAHLIDADKDQKTGAAATDKGMKPAAEIGPKVAADTSRKRTADTNERGADGVKKKSQP